MKSILVVLALFPYVAAQGSVASVQFMITQRMRGQLEMLGFTEQDINKLQPDRAAAIISRKIRRPRGGMPASWTRSGASSARDRVRRWLSIYAPITLLGLCAADLKACTAAAIAVNEAAHNWLRVHERPQLRRTPGRQQSSRQRPRAALYPWD